MKYEITDITDLTNSNLKRIRALRDIPEINVKKGDLGGYVQCELNLFQEGYCWIFNNAQVYENARVSGYAWVYGNAIVSGNAKVSGNAEVYERAKVSGYAWVSGDAQVYGDAQIFGNAQVYEHARVFGNAQVHENARVFGNAQVFGSASIYGKAQVFENAIIRQNHFVEFSKTTTDLSLKENIGDSIRTQCNLAILKDDQGEYTIGYKHVMKTNQEKVFISKYDPKFKYEIGKWSEVENPDLSNQSCASGLHFSHITYWTGRDCNAVIQVKCYIDDIITVQEGKIRAKKLFVIGEVKNGEL